MYILFTIYMNYYIDQVEGYEVIRKLVLTSNLMFKSLAVTTGLSVLAVAPLAAIASAETPSASLPWQTNKAYKAGDLVTYQGKTYKAKWWSYNSVPATSDSWDLIAVDQGDKEAPTTPAGLTNTASTDSSITLSWGPSTDNVSVSGYNIYRDGLKVGFTVSKIFTDYELQPNRTYFYAVKAVDSSGNESVGATLSAQTVTIEIPDLEVGQSRSLTLNQINGSWGGINEQFSPDKATEAVTAVLPRSDYEALFPRRAGSALWHTIAKGNYYYKPNLEDYYSYDNLIAAVREVANIKYKEVIRVGNPSAKEIYRLDKAAQTETLLFRSASFKSPEEINKPVETRIVDFGTFLKEGTENNRKRELAAFLANIAHETGGGWATAPDGELRWALFFNEELGHVNTDKIGYVDEGNTDYPAVSGKSYHGRGPIQLSWNYNYGLIGSIIYGDKNVLLNDPDRVAVEGRLGFMTAILFWMTPQDPKPSAHDVMVGNYVPTAEQLAKGLVPGFGATIMIINGALEGNLDESDSRIRRRVAHYTELADRAGIDITGEKLNTLGMQQF